MSSSASISMRRVRVGARRLLVACVVAGFGIGLGPPLSESPTTMHSRGSDRALVGNARATEFLATGRTSGTVRDSLDGSIQPLGESLPSAAIVEPERPGASTPAGTACGTGPDVAQEQARLCVWLI